MSGFDTPEPPGDEAVSADAVTGPIPYVAPRVAPTAPSAPAEAAPLPPGVRAWGAARAVPPEPPVAVTPEPPVAVTPEPPVAVTPEPPVAVTPEPPVAVTPEPVAAVTPRGPRRRTPVLVGAGALAVIALVLALIFGLGGGGGKQHATSAVVPSATVTATGVGGLPTSAQPTGNARSTVSAIDTALARQLIVRYLNDVNTRNRADGQTLICAAKVAAWRSSIDQSRGDFTVNIIQATFQGSTPRSTGIDLKYGLQITTAGTAANNSVTFTVIDEKGLKICGEA